MSNYEVRQLDFELEGKTIRGQVYLPTDAQEGKLTPTVICAHGLSRTYDQPDGYARELVRRGYVAYCFDFCDDVNSRSHSNVGEMTVFTEQNDLEDVFEEVAKLPYVDRNNIFLMGISMGAAVASLVAAHRNGVIKGLILLYPAFNIPGEINRAYPLGDEEPQDATLFDEKVGAEFVRSIRNFDFYAVIAGYTGPVLIMHGMSDELVASGYSVRAVNTYGNANLELIGEVGHAFEGGAFKYAVKKIVGFLDEEADLPDESGLYGDLNFGSGGMFG